MSGLLLGSDEEEPCSAGMPSTTYNGSLFAVSELVPRIRTLAPTPGMPELLSTCTPAARPCSAVLTVDVGAARMVTASPLTEATAPVRSRF